MKYFTKTAALRSFKDANKRTGGNLNKMITNRNKQTKGSATWNAAQNAINTAYGSTKTKRSTKGLTLHRKTNNVPEKPVATKTPNKSVITGPVSGAKGSVRRTVDKAKNTLQRITRAKRTGTKAKIPANKPTSSWGTAASRSKYNLAGLVRNRNTLAKTQGGKSSFAYKTVQNRINEAYGSKVRH